VIVRVELERQIAAVVVSFIYIFGLDVIKVRVAIGPQRSAEHMNKAYLNTHNGKFGRHC